MPAARPRAKPRVAELVSTARRPVVVLGLAHAGLAVVRSLGRLGADVTGIALHERDLGVHSRYVRKAHFISAADPAELDRAVLAAIAEAAARGRPLVIPTRDEHLDFVLRRWHAVRELADLPLPSDADAVLRLRRKERLPVEAEKIAIPAPRTTFVTSEEAIRTTELRPPFLLKSVEGHDYFEAFGRKAFVAHSVDEAVEAWRRAREHRFDLILQELIPNVEHSIFSLFTYIGRSGKPLASVVGRKVRQKPLTFGSAAVFEVRHEPRVLELGLRLLRAVDYRGFGHVEFAYDRRDGEFKLLEVNTRVPVWAGLAMSRHFDIGGIAYRDFCGNGGAPEVVFAERVVWIHFARDVSVSLQMLRRGELGVHDFIAPYLCGQKVRALFAADDLSPLIRWPLYAGSRVAASISERTV